LAAAEIAAAQRLASQEQALQLSCQAARSELQGQLQLQAAQKQQLLSSLKCTLASALPDHLRSGRAQASCSTARADNSVEIRVHGESAASCDCQRCGLPG
jgi:hypothetical protein